MARFKTEARCIEANKIETMLKDIKISEVLLLNNNQTMDSISTIKFNVKILTSGSWPIAN